MNEEVEKAVKALQAAMRKAGRAGVVATMTYTATDEDGSTHTERINSK